MLRFVRGVFAQVATAIRGAIIQAKMSVVPVRRGYWGNKIGKPHTVPTKVLLSVSIAFLQTTIGSEVLGHSCSSSCAALSSMGWPISKALAGHYPPCRRSDVPPPIPQKDFLKAMKGSDEPQ